MTEPVTVSPVPTEDTPELGTIAVAVGDQTIELSEVEHWVERGLHVFRSTEFDCMAEAEDEWKAVGVFVENAEDLFRFLDDLLDANRATAEETRTLVKLSRRFFEISAAAEEAERRRRSIQLRRHPRRPQWQPQIAHGNSSKLLHA